MRSSTLLATLTAVAVIGASAVGTVCTAHPDGQAAQIAKLATDAVTSVKIATGGVESSDFLDGTLAIRSSREMALQ